MAFISVDYHKIPISKMRLRLVCWDNFSLSHKIINLFRSDNSFVCVLAGNWYLLSQSLILLASVYSRGTRYPAHVSFVTTPLGGGGGGGGVQCSKKNCCMKSQSHETLWPPLLKLKFENDWLPSNYRGSSCKKINSGFQFQGFQFIFHFQFHQFQFQFRNWNWNWAAIPIPELNWPQPWTQVHSCGISNALAMEILHFC